MEPSVVLRRIHPGDRLVLLCEPNLPSGVSLEAESKERIRIALEAALRQAVHAERFLQDVARWSEPAVDLPGVERYEVRPVPEPASPIRFREFL